MFVFVEPCYNYLCCHDKSVVEWTCDEVNIYGYDTDDYHNKVVFDLEFLPETTFEKITLIGCPSITLDYLPEVKSLHIIKLSDEIDTTLVINPKVEVCYLEKIDNISIITNASKLYATSCCNLNIEEALFLESLALDECTVNLLNCKPQVVNLSHTSVPSEFMSQYKVLINQQYMQLEESK